MLCGDAGSGEDGEVELRECEERGGIVGARVTHGNALVAAGLFFMSRYVQERNLWKTGCGMCENLFTAANIRPEAKSATENRAF